MSKILNGKCWLNLCHLKLDCTLDVLKMRRTYHLAAPLHGKILSEPNVKYKKSCDMKSSKIMKISRGEVYNSKLLSDIILNRSLQEKKSLSEDLIDWAVHCNISHVAFSKLLKTLKSNGLTYLPATSHSLLKAREKRIKLFSVPPGVYVHYGIKKNLEKLISVLSEENLLINNNIKIAAFIDNLPLTKANNHGLWVICGSIVGFDNTIFLIGAYSGHKVPKNSNLFLDAFVEEARNLCLNGLQVGQKHFDVTIKRIICDAPARALVLNIKSGYIGYSSCTKCSALGEYRANKVCFPEKSNLRSDGDFKSLHLYKNNLATKLLEIPNFGVVSNMPLDFMHSVCIGVVKKLLSIWIESRNSKKLNNFIFEEKNKFCPNEFRALKPLGAHKNWSPSQLRLFLLYYGPIMMKSIITKTQYDHFLLLHVACRILCMGTNEEMLNEFAEKTLNTFVEDIKAIYGKKEMTLNVHGLYHLVDDCKLHGTLDDFSAFSFEMFLNQLKYCLNRSKKKSSLQTICKYQQEALLDKNMEKLKRKEIKLKKKIQKFDDEVQDEELKNCHLYERLKIKNAEIRLDKKIDSYVMLRCGKIVEVLHILKKSNKKIFVGGKEFLCISNYYKEPLDSSVLNIFQVKNLSEKVDFWPVEMIFRKCVPIISDNEEFVVCSMLDQNF